MSAQPPHAVVIPPAADEASPASDRSGRAVRGVVAGVGAGAAIAMLLVALPSPWVSSVLALTLLVLAPTAARLDRRITLNIALAVGWAPVALLVPPALGPRTAAVTALALASGGVAGAVVARSASLVPTWRPRDGVLLGAALLSALVASPLRSPGGADRALAMLSSGIDNSYHFAMYLEQRLTATGSALVAANADDSGFGFSSYPQWFHKMLTVLAQTMFGDATDAAGELVRYAQLQWLVFVAVVVLVTAALLQALPDQVPASLLVPALTVTWSLLLGVPGALNLIQGHLSFLLAASAPVVVFLLGRASRSHTPVVFVAMCGLVIVSASWMLLLPLAGAAILPPMLVLWRRQGTAVRWAALVLAAAGTAVAVGRFVFPWLFGAGLQAVVRDGTVPRVGLPTMTALLLGSVALLLVLRRRHPSSGLGPHLLLAGVSAAQMVVLGAYMLLTTGELTYYFWKLGLGSLLASLVVATHAVIGVRVTAAQASGRSAGVRPLVAALVTVTAAAGLGVSLQQFAAPSALWGAFLPSSMTTRVTSGQAGDVATVLRLAETSAPRDAARTRLLTTRPDDMNAAHASEWFHALSHSATQAAVSVDDPVYVLARDRGNVALATDIAVSTLRFPGRRVVVTDAGLYRSVLASVAAEQASRVTLVTGSPSGESP